MNQCDNCAHWKLTYKDTDTGKNHYGCKLTGYRSRGKWRKNECSAFEIKEGQMLLEV